MRSNACPNERMARAKRSMLTYMCTLQQEVINYISISLGWSQGTPASSTQVGPHRYVFETAQAISAAHDSADNTVADVQTPLAWGSHKMSAREKGLKRSGAWLTGATAFGSGTGARYSLNRTSSIARPPGKGLHPTIPSIFVPVLTTPRVRLSRQRH